MKNKFNNLFKYIYEYSEKSYRKETINGLFKAILEPIVQNQKIEAYVFIRLLESEDKTTILKRLEFSKVKIYNFSKMPVYSNYSDCEVENIWDKTEFIVVLAQRYSACLIWDYSDSINNDMSRICLLYNSRIISEIAKLIAKNSKQDLKEIIQKYTPDRRENSIFNKSVQTISDMLNEKNEEFVISQYEKNNFKNDEDTLKTAEIIKSKAGFIAHEIKNNLSIIGLYSQIASRRFNSLNADNDVIEAIENSLKNINNASENISYLISDLRCMSSPFKVKTDLKLLIEASIELCLLKINNENAKLIKKNIAEGTVYVDKAKVQCAIINIIFNALDAKARNITISANEKVIIITNDGNEIPKNIQKRIFEENFTTKEKGSGLGLAFCKKQLQLLGGDLNLISSNEIETVFEIKI